ncbi:MAG: rod shape-determining protein MreC [Candidatus Omnitrophica bacterium]|nr:rod shape-determining protein MreC [Candidatus Omnitrophota bacterium]
MVAVFLPFRKLIQNIFITISKSSFPPSKNKYINKIEQLEKKNLLLSLKIKHLNDIKNENTKLRKALQLEEEKTINLLGAEVLTFSPSNWRHIVTINKGSNDDIKEGQFAIDENGHLLGKIIEINKTSSRLILIDDPEFTTSVFVAKKDFGLLKGNLVGAKVLYIEDGSELKKGDKVWLKIPLINFPIEIGEIKKVKNNENSLFWDVDVKLYTKNSFFEKIFIIK